MKKLKKTGIFLVALLLALSTSLAVYGAVSYDSSQDPVVSLSGMKAYVSDAIADIKSAVTSLTGRVDLLELAIKSGAGGSGSGSGGEGGISLEALSQFVSRIEALEAANASLKADNEKINQKLDKTENELRSLISDLETSYNSVSDELNALKDSVAALSNQLTSLKNDVSTLDKNFKQISDISTKLQTLTYRIDALTAAGGDITVLREKYTEVSSMLNDAINNAGQLYSVVLVPYGSTVYAKDADDTVLVILRTGSAVAVSPFTTPGTAQGLNDLTDGSELYDSADLPLFHNVLIPRGADDGRGVTVTSVDGAYLMIGGDYVIVSP